MRRIALGLVLLVAIGCAAALAQSLYPNAMGGCGVGRAGCPLSGGGGKFTPPASLADDANAVTLTDDAGAVALTAQ